MKMSSFGASLTVRGKMLQFSIFIILCRLLQFAVSNVIYCVGNVKTKA